jgi:K+-sensing histidine kinase KdpD
VAVQHISEILDGEVLALLPNGKGMLNVAAGDLSSVLQKDIVKEIHVARSAYDTGQMTGWGTQASPATAILYVPLRAADTTLGILALRPRDPERFLLHEQLSLLESLAKQVALALEVELMCAAPSRVT